MAINNKRLTPLEVARLAYNAGVRGDENLVIAVAVCRGESSYYPAAYNGNADTGDSSYGLWQINMIGKLGPARREQYKLKSNDDLFKPEVNAHVMFTMSKKGTNWRPWGAFTNGSYEKHLTEAKAAVKALNEELNPKPKKPAPAKPAPVKPVPAKPAAVKPPKVVKVAPPWISFAQVNAAALGATGVYTKPGTKDTSKDDVERVQAALKKTVGLDYSSGPGTWGPKTKAAYKKYQKSLGYTGADADGVPGPDSLTKLGKATGLFQVRDFLTVSKPKAVVAKVTGGKAASPVPGHAVTYAYGVKNSRYAAGYHTGADYAAAVGTPVVAVRNGRIIRSDGAGGAYGNWIQLLADDGHVYMYAHLSSRQVSVGQTVKAGQQIGKVGATGNVTGPHLHFEKSKGSSWRYGWVQKPVW
jgi:murein DD-endopeptidase MepM/ murein hydrolase activator NlpD